jgi:hypothetical protein
MEGEKIPRKRTLVILIIDSAETRFPLSRIQLFKRTDTTNNLRKVGVLDLNSVAARDSTFALHSLLLFIGVKKASWQK